MRVLILGAAGMLGHKLVQTYQDRYETWATVRTGYHHYERYGLFDSGRIIGGVNADDFDTVVRAFGQVQPDVVINCIGVIKQLAAAKDPITSLKINSLFPHQVANLARAAGARFFHISTDCVFNGRDGDYNEDSPSNAEDLYGRTKFLGEVDQPGCVTLRTSIIGRELNSQSGLVEWFLSNRGVNDSVRGFRQAIYTGFTTQVLADIIADIIDHHSYLSGLYQVSSGKINKYDLLMLVRDAYGMTLHVEPYDDFVLDRSLDSTRFRRQTGFTPPSWAEMIHQMATDPTPYDSWRK